MKGAIQWTVSLKEGYVKDIDRHTVIKYLVQDW